MSMLPVMQQVLYHLSVLQPVSTTCVKSLRTLDVNREPGFIQLTFDNNVAGQHHEKQHVQLL